MEVLDTTASRSEEENDGMNNQYLLNYRLKIELCVDVNTFAQLLRDYCDWISKQWQSEFGVQTYLIM